MENIDKKKQFIELRSRGWSFQKIAEVMNLSKRALIVWSKEFKAEIQLKHQLEMDGLKSLNHEAEEGRLAVIRAQWEKLRAEVERRNLRMLSTDKLLHNFMKATDLLKGDAAGEEQELVELPSGSDLEELHQKLFDVPKESVL